MADESFQEKTEPASDKKREEARRKGKVPRSVELNSALVLLFGLLILSFGGTAMVSGLAEVVRSSLLRSGTTTVSIANLHNLATEGLMRVGAILAPVILGIMVVGLAAAVLQVGFVFSPEVMRPTFDKINPLNGIKKIMISRRSVVELAKSLLKVGLVGWVAWWSIQDVIADCPALVESDASSLMGFLGKSAGAVGLRMALAFMVLAILDFFYQRVEHEREMRMSKEEVKEETKATEGDPMVKSRIRTIQRRIAYRRMMADVPKADVVITNPTHLAVAVRYDVQEMNAPTVVAKGADLVALKIKEIALEHHVPVVEDRPLAQALYKSVDIGEQIPEKLFQAVAQLLAYIYKLKNQKQSAYGMN
jgi:flagellar biosynthesis protein FlhB